MLLFWVVYWFKLPAWPFPPGAAVMGVAALDSFRELKFTFLPSVCR